MLSPWLFRPLLIVAPLIVSLLVGPLVGMLVHSASAQDLTTTRPVVGIREVKSPLVLITGADVVVRAGQVPERLSILIDGGTIKQVGPNIEPPSGIRQIDLSGKRIYPGFVDAMHEVSLPKAPTINGPGYWNQNITPQYRAAWAYPSIKSRAKKLRSQGITAQLLAPRDGIVKGTSCLVLTLDDDSPNVLLRDRVFQHATLTVPRGDRRDRYPNSPMGAVALLRQSLYDARWHHEANIAYQNLPHLPRPEPNVALDTLYEDQVNRTFVIDADNERMALRADTLASEFSLNVILRGSGREYRDLNAIVATGRPILLPVNFADKPATGVERNLSDVPLRDWMHWHFAPENPGRIDQAGAKFCLTTDKLDDPGNFLKRVRQAVRRGLAPDAALAALTTTPAKWLGIGQRAGQIEPGMLANLVVTEGDLFESKGKVLETWVAGKRHLVKSLPKPDPIEGKWTTQIAHADRSVEVVVTFEKSKQKLMGRMERFDASSSQPKDAEDDDKQADKAALTNLDRGRQSLAALLRLSELGDSFSSGIWRLEVAIRGPGGEDSPPVEDQTKVFGTLTDPSGRSQRIGLKRVSAEEQTEPSTAADEMKSEPSQEEKEQEEAGRPRNEPIKLNYPLGAYGVATTDPPPKSVLFRGATVWTCDESGKLEDTDVLVQNGKIAAIGPALKPDGPCRVIDVKGKHLSPGIIDCHSHMATDGGVNESGQTITSQVRIGDFINNTDITIYRQLAGGVTTANILHGSANPIGGQNQVIKLRWGASMDQLKFSAAPRGIKFALGENVKRNSNRYPNTRMGVEQIIRDTFLAARSYANEHRQWDLGRRDGLPPRRDLQLDAIVEVLRGDRWIHCHSYRQDEIVATLDLLDEFHVRIGTLQHILEGYKVADRMADHRAMASSFADWWAYKFEVYDAIPYNGVLMHDADVVVSYNSDDAELGRHLNTEAAKATKYGGVPEQEALKFVTLNPAKQLRIEDRVGSLAVGKDADLVVWSGRPLSTTSRCEQTWIDGKRFFDRKTDRELRKRDQATKQRLIQMALDEQRGQKDNANPPKKSTSNQEPVEQKPADQELPETDQELPEEERWETFDRFCQTRDRQENKLSEQADQGDQR